MEIIFNFEYTEPAPEGDDRYTNNAVF